MAKAKGKKLRWLWCIPVVAVLIVIAVAFGMGDDSSTLMVDTPFCKLDYPAEWQDTLRVSEEDTDGVYAKTFSANLGGTEYALFTLYFGEAAQGDLYGYFSDEAHTPVYIVCHTLPEGHTLTAEQEGQFYTMQDGINVVVESLASAEGFMVN